MTDATEDFFHELRRRGHDRRFEIDNGSVRFDINAEDKTDHWLVTVKDGDITVSEATTGGETVVRAEREAFNRLARGELYLLTAVLRGELSVEGVPRLFALMRRMFPAPPAFAGKRERVDVRERPHG